MGSTGQWARQPDVRRVCHRGRHGDQHRLRGRTRARTSAATPTRMRSAKFSGGTWSSLSGIALNGPVFALAIVGRTLYVGGGFDNVGGGNPNYMDEVAAYGIDSGVWSPITDATHAMTGTVAAIRPRTGRAASTWRLLRGHRRGRCGRLLAHWTGGTTSWSSVGSGGIRPGPRPGDRGSDCMSAVISPTRAEAPRRTKSPTTTAAPVGAWRLQLLRRSGGIHLWAVGRWGYRHRHGLLQQRGRPGQGRRHRCVRWRLMDERRHQRRWHQRAGVPEHDDVLRPRRRLQALPGRA